ncbi:MAG: phospholipase D family protein, partial [Thermoproteota archaeon]
LMEKSNKIIIKVPFIDDYGYSLLTKFKEKKIYVITREDNPYISRLLNENIKVKTMPKIHTKLYFFEDGENSLCIHGSINLTYTSFHKNEENMVIVWNLSEVKRIKDEILEAKENEDN